MGSSTLPEWFVKILHNNCHTTARPRLPQQVRINNMTIDVLTPLDNTKYLGRKLSFSDPHRTEIENRIANAWRKFFLLKQELTGSRYCLTDRLRLFHGTVTPTILYGCEAWTLTGELENRLRRTQRQMLRMILHAPRRMAINSATAPPTTANTDDDDEDVDSAPSTPRIPPQPSDDNDTTNLEPWVRRCTHDAEARMKKLNLDDWIAMHRRRKWAWAHRVAIADTSLDWTRTALLWDPTLDTTLRTHRRQGRPKTRWTDDIRNYLLSTQQSPNTLDNTANDRHDNHNSLSDDNSWINVAQNKELWKSLEDGFVKRAS